MALEICTNSLHLGVDIGSRRVPRKLTDRSEKPKHHTALDTFYRRDEERSLAQRESRVVKTIIVSIIAPHYASMFMLSKGRQRVARHGKVRWGRGDPHWSSSAASSSLFVGTRARWCREGGVVFFRLQDLVLSWCEPTSINEMALAASRLPSLTTTRRPKCLWAVEKFQYSWRGGVVVSDTKCRAEEHNGPSLSWGGLPVCPTNWLSERLLIGN